MPFYDRALLHHDGGTFGSSSSLLVDRATGEGVFIVANTATPLFDVALHLLDRRHSLAPRVLPKTVEVAPDVLAAYAGAYKIDDRMTIVVRVEGGRVTAQATGQGEFELFPESDTRFFAKVAPIVITFADVAAGKSGRLVLEQGGATLTGRRIP